MKIAEAMKLLNPNATISSEEAEMFSQDAGTFCYWLLMDGDMDNTFKIKNLIKILQATDWELDIDYDNE